MIGAGNALGMFEAGRLGGQVKGTFGIGNAIRGMLEQANKKGLIREQTEGNMASAIGAASVKNQVEAPVGFPGGQVPPVTEENGMYKVPDYDAQGRPTGGFKYIKKAPDTMFSFLSDNTTTPGGTTPVVGNTTPLTVEQEYQLYQNMLKGQ